MKKSASMIMDLLGLLNYSAVDIKGISNGVKIINHPHMQLTLYAYMILVLISSSKVIGCPHISLNSAQVNFVAWQVVKTLL